MGGNGFRFNEIFIKIPKIPLYYQPFFSHLAVKKYSYHSCTILSVLCKVKLLPLGFLFLLFAAIFGYCSNQVCLSFSFRFFSSLFFFCFLFFMNCLLVIHESDIQCFCTPKNQNKLALCTPKNIESKKKRKLLLELPVQLKKNCIQNFESENCQKTAVNLKVRTAGELN